MIEKDVQSRVVKILKAYGGEVYDLAQGFRPGGKRHGTTRQTRGLADLCVFFPRWKRHIWFEVKKRNDTWPLDGVDPEIRETFYRKLQRDEQSIFEQHCFECDVTYILGGFEEAREYCETMQRRANVREVV